MREHATFFALPPADMDVRCNRCDTEYEFDDALISERGTTVKCTNCGFQFKIYPSKGTGMAPERWVVRTASGRELVYTSLRELQRGIADKKVVASDLLSRGKQTPRPLGSIAELEPFFQVTHANPPRKSGSGERVQRTLHGVAPPQPEFRAYRSEPPAPVRVPSQAPAAIVTPAPPPAVVAPQSGIDVPSPAPPATQPVPGALAFRDAARSSAASEAIPDTELMSRPMTAEDLSATLPSENVLPRPRAVTESAPDSRSSFAGTPMSPRVVAFDTTLEVPVAHAPVSSPRNLPPIEVANIRDSFKSYDELNEDSLPEDHHARVARSRWIAGVVVVGVLGLLGATVGRRFIAQLTGTAEIKSDARVARFLSEGARLADEGDFEGAKEEFDKAAALAEKDPAVLTALARLETLRADVSWLKLRVIDPASIDLVQATHRELGRRVGKAHVAVDRAFAVSPEDPAVLRARVDALRLNGEADKAREWLAPLSANASVPENAYVLAALDLADPAPVWPSVIDRLRTAAAAERDPGRARAALIYALVRASRMSEAETEFAKIDGRAKPHPLLEELRGFLLRAKRSVEAAGDAPAKLAAVDTSKLPKLDTSLTLEEGRLPTGDFRTRLSQASVALRQGNLARAAQLYESVLSEQPRNTEALSGLADVAKARHDPALAAKMYDRVLTENPNYWPALLASADQKWDAGDKPAALVLYRRLLEQAGPNSEYGARAAARLANSDAPTPAGSAAPVETGATLKPEVPPAPTPQPAQPSEIDTTDLPGTK
ncbi:MAG TPA: zinc-ribbon domain-containing protein [Polyangiaceae bacterium]|nr:zinc-ribbon domain-containing protein [Polyangiaceae bacterium]